MPKRVLAQSATSSRRSRSGLLAQEKLESSDLVEILGPHPTSVATPPA